MNNRIADKPTPPRRTVLHAVAAAQEYLASKFQSNLRSLILDHVCYRINWDSNFQCQAAWNVTFRDLKPTTNEYVNFEVSDFDLSVQGEEISDLFLDRMESLLIDGDRDVYDRMWKPSTFAIEDMLEKSMEIIGACPYGYSFEQKHIDEVVCSNVIYSLLGIRSIHWLVRYDGIRFEEDVEEFEQITIYIPEEEKEVSYAFSPLSKGWTSEGVPCDFNGVPFP